jgi:ABC-type transporter Mla subunit MlaD
MKRKRRPDAKRSTLLAALAGGLILIVYAYVAVTASNGVPLRGYYKLNADFRDAAELDQYADVRVAGKLVGQVLGASFRDGTAVVRLQLEPSAGPLRADTTARIRLRGLIGSKFVELVPGVNGPKLRSGATIPASQTSTSVAVFDVLASLDAKRRADLRALLGGLGEGFSSRGEPLNRALTHAPALVSGFQRAADAVNARAGAAQRLVPAVQSLAAAFDPVRSQLAGSFAPEARSLQPFVDERSGAQATLDRAPAALDVLRSGLGQTDPLLVETAGFARAAIRLTRPAPAALASAARLLRDAPVPLKKAATAVQGLAAAVPPTLDLLGALAPLAAPLERSLANSIPGLDYIGRYRCDAEAYFQDWRAVFQDGTPPNSVLGPVGLARAAVTNNSSTANANTPGGIPARFYEAPCTATLDHTP